MSDSITISIVSLILVVFGMFAPAVVEVIRGFNESNRYKRECLIRQYQAAEKAILDYISATGQLMRYVDQKSSLEYGRYFPGVLLYVPIEEHDKFFEFDNKIRRKQYDQTAFSELVLILRDCLATYRHLESTSNK